MRILSNRFISTLIWDASNLAPELSRRAHNLATAKLAMTSKLYPGRVHAVVMRRARGERQAYPARFLRECTRKMADSLSKLNTLKIERTDLT